MAVSNKSNKSGLDADELSAVGEESSITLSDALQSALLAFKTPNPAVLDPRTVRVSDELQFYRMNARHRDHLLVKELLKDVTVTEVAVPAPGTDKKAARLMVGTNSWLSLTLDLSNPGFWDRQVNDLISMKWHRDDRMSEIVLQQTDLLSFMTLGLPVAADTHPWLMVLMDIVQAAAFQVAAEFKAIFQMPRPDRLSGMVAPIIRTPAHSAVPSGHATEAFAAAAVLSALFPDTAFPGTKTRLRLMAARIAMNRSFAGVHCAVDHHAGALLGDALGRLFNERALGGAVPTVSTETAFTIGVTPGGSGSLGVDVENYASLPPAFAMNAGANPATGKLLPLLMQRVRAEL